MPGTADQCPKCSKIAYAAERVMGPSRKFYHKSCLLCASCGNRLAPGAFQEHEEQPYCRNCHLKFFSTVDLRHQNLPSRDSVSPNSLPTRTLAVELAPGYTGLTNAKPVSSPMSRTIPGGTRFVAPSRVECPRCGGAVYHAEQVVAVGKKWHRTCLQCSSCQKRLDSHNVSDKDGEPYCKLCYSKKHGPAGTGYALLGGPGG